MTRRGFDAFLVVMFVRDRLILLCALACCALVLVSVVLVLPCGALGAGLADSPPNDGVARRDAEADCYRKLYRAALGVPINIETTVRDFVAESAEIRLGVEALVCRAKLGSPHLFEEGVCHVEGELDVAAFVAGLKKIQAEHPQNDWIAPEDFDNIVVELRTRVFRVIGSGKATDVMPLRLPEGAEALITPLPNGYTPAPLLVGSMWRRIGPPARRRAEADGFTAATSYLLERVKGLRIGPSMLAGDLLVGLEASSTQAMGLVAGAKQVGRRIHPEELLVDVTVELSLDVVAHRLDGLYAQDNHRHGMTATDIQTFSKRIGDGVIRATASGVPRRKHVYRLIREGIKIPKWSPDTFKGRGTSSWGDSPVILAEARSGVRKARAMARRQLAKMIYALRIDGRTTVRDYAIKHPKVVSQLRGVLSDSVTLVPSFKNGETAVSVTLAGVDVWECINQHRIILGRRR